MTSLNYLQIEKDKSFKGRDHYFKTYGTPTPFIKLENLTNYLGGAQIYAKVLLKQMEGHNLQCNNSLFNNNEQEKIYCW